MKNYLRNLKVKTKRKFTALSTMVLTLLVANSVKATDGLPTKSAGEVSRKVINAYTPVFTTIGAIAIFLGVGLIGFELIMSNKNPEKRSSAMSSLLWVGGGAILLGSVSLIAGFFWGMGTN